MPEPLLLSRRLGPSPRLPGGGDPEAMPVLELGAADRQRLRGHCRSRCGRDLLLQLPRDGGALEPGELLADGQGVARVRVEAAAEDLLVVRSDAPLSLLRAAYHLGNRHVALQVLPGELRLLQDPVLAQLLRGLGMEPSGLQAPFHPEAGAYGGHSHSHDQGPSGEHDAGGHEPQAHDNSQGPGHPQMHHPRHR